MCVALSSIFGANNTAIEQGDNQPEPQRTMPAVEPFHGFASPNVQELPARTLTEAKGNYNWKHSAESVDVGELIGA